MMIIKKIRHLNLCFMLVGLIGLTGCSDMQNYFGFNEDGPEVPQVAVVKTVIIKGEPIEIGEVEVFQSNLNDVVLDKDAIIKEVQNILNETNSFSGNFIQVSTNGANQSGKIWLKKPGKMRIQYKSGLLMLADGESLVYYDPSIDQKTLIDLDTTPAGVLVQKNIKLQGGDLKVQNAYESDGKYFLSVALKADAGLGTAEFVLSKKNRNIVGWVVRDAQGVSTNFEIKNMKKNISVSNSNFILKTKKNFGSDGEVKNGNGFY